jgi:hypothetical protein
LDRVFFNAAKPELSALYRRTGPETITPVIFDQAWAGITASWRKHNEFDIQVQSEEVAADLAHEILDDLITSASNTSSYGPIPA